MGDDKKKIKLLLVDDEEEFRRSASKALTRQGFFVSEAESGERALEMLVKSAPDLMVLDLRMGGIDGIAALEKARKIMPNLPVVILTGHGRFENALAGIRLDIVDFVQKPVDMGDLGARIHRLLAEGGKVRLYEKTIGELMVPMTSYRRFYMDQTVKEIVEAIADLLFRPQATLEVARQGRRAVLVLDRQDEFVGLIRMENILELMVPAYLRNSPYSSYYRGMFLAQAKLIGKETANELMTDPISIEVDRPLMEALNLMIRERLTNLAVTRNGAFVGILRDEDIFKEIADSILWK
jgi:CheY-like chemotaxis protein